METDSNATHVYGTHVVQESDMERVATREQVIAWGNALLKGWSLNFDGTIPKVDTARVVFVFATSSPVLIV